MSRGQYRWGLLGIGVVWLAAVVMAVWPDPPSVENRQIARFLFAAGVGAIAWWSAIVWTTRFQNSAPSNGPDYASLAGMAGTALFARAFLLAIAPEATILSDDVFRYMWDGFMIDQGINPFYFAPDAEILTPLRDPVFHPNINHPHLPTIYPPLSQAAFWLAYKLTPESIMGFRIVSLAAEVGAWISAWWYLRVARVRPEALVVLLWCPLMVWEFNYSTHLDVLALPLLIVGLTLLERKQPVAAAAVLAAAGGVKFFGWMFLPLCFWDQPWRRQWRAGLAAGIVIMAMYAPFRQAGWDVIGSLPAYLREWRFNGSLYQVLARTLGDPSWLRWTLGGALALWIGWGTRRWHSTGDRWLATWTGYIVFATTVFPWYMLWVLPALLRRRWPPMLWLAGTIFLSYQFLIDYESTGSWADYIWCTYLEYGVFYLLLFVASWRWWRHRHSQASLT